MRRLRRPDDRRAGAPGLGAWSALPLTNPSLHDRIRRDAGCMVHGRRIASAGSLQFPPAVVAFRGAGDREPPAARWTDEINFDEEPSERLRVLLVR